jgi:cell wall-active antibiotic response 4TMS protein YvqF
MVVEPRRTHNVPGLVIGLTLMALGTGLLLDRTGVIAALGWQLFWPSVLIVLALVKLAFPRHDGHRDGGWMLFIGVLLLLNQLDVLRFQQSWPLFVAAVGVSIVWKEIVQRRPRARERVE